MVDVIAVQLRRPCRTRRMVGAMSVHSVHRTRMLQFRRAVAYDVCRCLCVCVCGLLLLVLCVTSCAHGVVGCSCSGPAGFSTFVDLSWLWCMELNRASLLSWSCFVLMVSCCCRDVVVGGGLEVLLCHVTCVLTLAHIAVGALQI